ncbi:hypothetical protein RRG08_048570 [Elysia crispata]|uniref:Uncharacterized protein n=1 Tax=Elysia crispata TaxID=231223 RepID=A0AAE1EAG7_9GAST|nr:hypothetical protein RRG08_048570 [Elysia crispata]
MIGYRDHQPPLLPLPKSCRSLQTLEAASRCSHQPRLHFDGTIDVRNASTQLATMTLLYWTLIDWSILFSDRLNAGNTQSAWSKHSLASRPLLEHGLARDAGEGEGGRYCQLLFSLLV